MTRTPRGLAALLLLVVGALLLPIAPAAMAATSSAISPAATGTVEGAASQTSLRVELRRSLKKARLDRRVSDRTAPAFDSLVGDQAQIPEGCVAVQHPQTSHDICVLGDVDAARTVVLLGSSHAAMWLAGLEGPAQRGASRIIPLIKYGCSPLVLRTRVKDRDWPECADYRRWALARIAELSPDLVVVGTHTYTYISDGRGGQLKEGSRRYERSYSRGLTRLVTALQETSDRVVVLGDLARRRPAVRPARCLLANDRRYAPCENRLSARDDEMLARDASATRAAGGEFFDTNRLTCLRRRCPVAAGGIYVYRDFSHVSRTWSLHVGEVLAARIRLLG